MKDANKQDSNSMTPGPEMKEDLKYKNKMSKSKKRKLNSCLRFNATSKGQNTGEKDLIDKKVAIRPGTGIKSQDHGTTRRTSEMIAILENVNDRFSAVQPRLILK